MSLVVAAPLTAVKTSAGEPDVQLLWPNGAPRAVGQEEADRPSLTIYVPAGARRERTAVVVCPGGGYGGLAVDHEGQQIAEWLNSLGVTAAVLRYRIAPRYRHPAPLEDAQRALRMVRAQSSQLGIDPAHLGIIGFSAGGHLASTAATHFDAGTPDAADRIERPGCRPDFAILVYPVIALATEYAHVGSRNNLLGESPDPKLLASLSNETQVTADTPPCFLVHSTADQAVVPENSVLFYLALRRAGVGAELHIFENGPHGFGLGRGDKVLSTWPVLCADWLRGRGFLTGDDPKK